MLVVIILMWQLLSAIHCTRLQKIMFLVEVIFHIESTISYDLYIQLVEEICEKLILKIKLSKKNLQKVKPCVLQRRTKRQIVFSQQNFSEGMSRSPKSHGV